MQQCFWALNRWRARRRSSTNTWPSALIEPIVLKFRGMSFQSRTPAEGTKRPFSVVSECQARNIP